jgi:hypothetical protein
VPTSSSPPAWRPPPSVVLQAAVLLRLHEVAQDSSKVVTGEVNAGFVRSQNSHDGLDAHEETPQAGNEAVGNGEARGMGGAW